MTPRLKKEIREWMLLITICSVIYFAGWHTELIGKAQQLVLSTQLIEAEREEAEKLADFNFTLSETDGNTVSLKDFQGKILFMNFWATWCPPCIAEMPNIEALYLLKKEEVVFIMVSLDKDHEKALSFMKRKGYSFPVYFPKSRIPASYPIDVVPTTFVIDKNGVIRVLHEGMANYNTEDFRELLSGLSKTE